MLTTSEKSQAQTVRHHPTQYVVAPSSQSQADANLRVRCSTVEVCTPLMPIATRIADSSVAAIAK
jgi:hypothetical protein